MKFPKEEQDANLEKTLQEKLKFTKNIIKSKNLVIVERPSKISTFVPNHKAGPVIGYLTYTKKYHFIADMTDAEYDQYVKQEETDSIKEEPQEDTKPDNTQ